MAYGKIFNPWTGYLTRSYIELKNSMLTRLAVSNPELSDQSESNPLVLIISMFCGVGEMMGYYVDNMAAEAYIPTVRRYSSAIKLVKLIDYRVKASSPSSVDITLTFKNNQGVITPLLSDYVIPAGTEFTTSNGIKFTTLITHTILLGNTMGIIGASEITTVGPIIIGTTSGLPNQLISLGQSYADNTISLLVGTDIYTNVQTFGFSSPTDKHFIIEISIDKIAYIQFGDGTNGIIPTSGHDLTGTYRNTTGINGNVDAYTINAHNITILPTGISTIDVVNNLASVSGTDYENLETIKRRAPLSLRTLDRAVTKKDYQDVASMATGVEDASVFFKCLKNIVIYIAPEGGGIAQSTLLNSSLNHINSRKIIGTNVVTVPSGITELLLSLNITGRLGLSALTIQNEVEAAILDEWSYSNSYINRPLRLSDIYALVDNLPTVDYLDVVSVKTIPYARPQEHIVPLVATINVLDNDSKHIYRIQYNSDINILIYKDNSYIQSVSISDTITIGTGVEITINTGPYIPGMKWEFITYETGVNLELDDYSVPIISLNNLTLNITENLI